MFDDPGSGDASSADPESISLEARLGIGEPTGPADDRDDVLAGASAIEAADPLLPPPPSGWTDLLTSTDGPRLWDRIVSSEQARIRRYRRPATICLVDLGGYEGFARRWGPGVGERQFVRIARALAAEVRSSDHIARVGPTRIAILLTETDEIAAINFVERARASCEAHLGLDDGLWIGMGWASPVGPGGLAEAFQVAAHRLQEDLARGA